MPILSVIIPVYNAERTLRECVDSVLQQDVKDFELILVDDGSKDASPVICDEYASRDNRVRVIHQQNAGVSAARNRGLDIAQGEWITFVDSDDKISEKYFSPVYLANGDLVVCGHQDLNVDSSVGRKFLPHSQVVRKDNLASYLNDNITSFKFRGPCCKFYRKLLLDGIKFPLDMKVAEDSCFVLSYLTRVNSIIVINTSFYLVRVHEISPARRYSCSVEYAVNSLENLFLVYSKLEQKIGLSRRPFLSFVSFFKQASKEFWINNASLWYRNKSIIEMYKYVWEDLPFRQKLRLIVAYTLKK